MAINDVYKLTVRASVFGQTIQNTYHFRRKTAPDPTVADALALANTMKEFFRDNQVDDLAYTTWALDQVVGGTVTYPQPLCRKQGGILFVGNHTGTLFGGDVNDPLPPQVACVTTLRTGQSGRTRRGRSYLGGLSETTQGSGVFVTGFVSLIVADWAAILTQFGPTGTDPNWQIGVFSQVTATGCKDNPDTVDPEPVPFATPSPTTAFAAITETATKTTVFSQRKRTIGVGQ